MGFKVQWIANKMNGRLLTTTSTSEPTEHGSIPEKITLDKSGCTLILRGLAASSSL